MGGILHYISILVIIPASILQGYITLYKYIGNYSGFYIAGTQKPWGLGPPRDASPQSRPPAHNPFLVVSSCRLFFFGGFGL